MTSATTSRGQEWRSHNLLFAEDFIEQKYRGYTRRCKPLISKRNRSRASKILGQEFYGLILWTKVMERLKFGEKEIAHDPNIQAHLKHSGGNVMAWAFIASSGTGSLIFNNDVTHDGSSKINSEVYRNILSENLQKDATKLIGRSFIMQQDNDPKHSAKTTEEFHQGKKWKVLDWPSQSPHLNPVEYAFYLLKKRLKGVTPQNWKRLRWKPGKASQKKNAKFGDVNGSQAWCSYWKQGLQLNIKSFSL